MVNASVKSGILKEEPLIRIPPNNFAETLGGSQKLPQQGQLKETKETPRGSQRRKPNPSSTNLMRQL